MFDITRGYEPQKRVKPWILGEKYMDTDPKKLRGLIHQTRLGIFHQQENAVFTSKNGIPMG